VPECFFTPTPPKKKNNNNKNFKKSDNALIGKAAFLGITGKAVNFRCFYDSVYYFVFH
jgi:hypothetical protein